MSIEGDTLAQKIAMRRIWQKVGRRAAGVGIAFKSPGRSKRARQGNHPPRPEAAKARFTLTERLKVSTSARKMWRDGPSPTCRAPRLEEGFEARGAIIGTAGT